MDKKYKFNIWFFLIAVLCISSLQGWLEQRANRALTILELNKDLLLETSKALLERETLDYDDLQAMAGNIKQLPASDTGSPRDQLKYSQQEFQNNRTHTT